jgi:hypothetical protein
MMGGVLPDPYPYGYWTRYASEQIYKEAKRSLRKPNYGIHALDRIEGVARFVRPVGAPWESTPIWPVLRYFLPAIEHLAKAAGKATSRRARCNGRSSSRRSPLPESFSACPSRLIRRVERHRGGQTLGELAHQILVDGWRGRSKSARLVARLHRLWDGPW